MERRHQGENFARVPFLFGVSEAKALPGPVLVHLLGDLGATAASAKGLLHRMTRYGMLDLTRHGRVGVYRLAGRMAENYGGVLQPGPVEWDGRFHSLVYEIPETRRAQRETFLTAASHHGYRTLRPGVLLALEDRAAGLGTLLEDAGVVTGWLEVDDPTRTSLVRRCWQLDRLAAEHRGTAAKLRRAAAARSPEGPEALRRLHSLTAPAFALMVETASLPAELLPVDWPHGELGKAVAAVSRNLGPAAHAYAASVVETLGYGHLAEPDDRWSGQVESPVEGEKVHDHQ